jgi:hypothetical protein
MLSAKRWQTPDRWIEIRVADALTSYFPAGGPAVVAFVNEMNNSPPMLPGLCGWIERTIDEDPTCVSKIVEVRDALFTCLDVLVRSGVAQASEVENRILRLLPDRKTA